MQHTLSKDKMNVASGSEYLMPGIQTQVPEKEVLEIPSILKSFSWCFASGLSIKKKLRVWLSGIQMLKIDQSHNYSWVLEVFRKTLIFSLFVSGLCPGWCWALSQLPSSILFSLIIVFIYSWFTDLGQLLLPVFRELHPLKINLYEAQESSMAPA